MNYFNLSKLLTLLIPVLFASCKNSGDTKTEQQTENPPNIILILSDDQAWDDYSFMGHEHIQTPNIDRLAQQGMTFTQGFVPASLCRPSLASLVTGLYPHQHKILGNDPIIRDREKYSWGPEFMNVRAKHNSKYIENMEKLETLPDMLGEIGYVSFQTGKWWEGNYKIGGFDFGLTHGDPERGGRHGDEGLKIGREGMDTIFNFINYAQEKDKPFFVWYAPFLPHAPHTPPDSLLQKYLPLAPSEPVAAYWAMCDFFDYTCGQLMDFVAEKGLNENTLVIYVCDNGWVQDENRPNRYAEPSKRSPFNTGVKTPIMFKWDGKIDPQFNRNNPVSSTDIVPTVLDLVGLEPNENMHGINVLDSETLKNRKAIFGEIYAHDFSTIDSSIFYRLAITDPYKLILPDENNKPEEDIMLFNIIEDPHEKENLAREMPDVVKNLSSMIDEFWGK